MQRLKTVSLASVVVVAISSPFWSLATYASYHEAKSAVPAAEMADGEVKKVDKDAGKLTIKHGPLANLDMPAMTMVFRVKDPAMLNQVKVGDKVKFVADKVNGAYIVMKIEPLK